MSFFTNSKIIIRDSNKFLHIFNIDDGIIYNEIDNNLNTLSSQNIISKNCSFVDIWLDINNDDSIYGLINKKNGKIIEICLKNSTINESTLFKYDFNTFSIKFPFIKKVKDKTHILYFSINNNNPYCCSLMHLYYDKDKFIKNTIDCISYNILTNFIVIFINNSPIIFYFKIINDYEQLFVSKFNIETLTWLAPIQITNSKKGKIYLSIIKNNSNYFHIIFSENNSGKYFCKYLNLYIDNNEFKIIKSLYIRKESMCVFPILIQNKSILYAQWIEYHNIFTCISYDFGKTWGDPFSKKLALTSPILIYQFKSNYYKDKSYNLSSLFGFNNDFEIEKIIPTSNKSDRN